MDSRRDLEQRSPVAHEVTTTTCTEGGDEALVRVGRGGGAAVGRGAASSAAAAVAVAATIPDRHPAEDAISEQHAREEVDECSVAGRDDPSITRRHRGLQRDRDAVLQHVAARRRHGSHRPTLHEAQLEVPHRVVIKAAECRPRVLRDLEGVREVGGVW